MEGRYGRYPAVAAIVRAKHVLVAVATTGMACAASQVPAEDSARVRAAKSLICPADVPPTAAAPVPPLVAGAPTRQILVGMELRVFIYPTRPTCPLPAGDELATPRALGRGEPPPHSPVDLAYANCEDRDGEIRCAAQTPGRARSGDGYDRLRTCFDTVERPANSLELAAASAAVSGRLSVMPRGQVPAFLVIKGHRIRRGPVFRARGCEGVVGQPCDPIAEPTGRVIDRSEGLWLTVSPTGALVDVRWPYARSGPFLVHWFSRPSSAPGRAGTDPALVVLPEERVDSPQELWRASADRLDAFDTAGEDRVTRMIVAEDRAVYALALGDRERAARAVATLRGELAAAGDPVDVVAKRDADLADAFVRGYLTTNDPCAVPASDPRAR
jgi:hypothetical protein